MWLLGLAQCDHPLTPDVVDANRVVVVPITGLASNHNVLPNCSFPLVVADTHDAGVKDAIELPNLRRHRRESDQHFSEYPPRSSFTVVTSIHLTRFPGESVSMNGTIHVVESCRSSIVQSYNTRLAYITFTMAERFREFAT